MVKMKPSAVSLFLVLMALAVCFAFHAAPAHAGTYTLDAALIDGNAYPGVYYVQANPADARKTDLTIGIPSLNKNALTAPTTESPAIIMGAAVPYEVKTGPTEFTQIPGGQLYPPYSYFPHIVTQEPGADGTTHAKLSGFDGTYYIIRVDVSELIKDAPNGSFLHVKQAGNKALMPLLRYEKYNAAENPGKGSFSDALGNMTAVYAISNSGIVMKDTEGNDKETPYVDLLIYSSGTLVAGADTGSTAPDAASADFKLKFYIDQIPDYNTGLDYDPQSTATTHAQDVLNKFYDDNKDKDANAKAVIYTVKGNDLEIEVTDETNTHFWSLREAMGYYNNVPIKMICEVPVLEGLRVDGGRHVIFDVNSFDIQIANHQTTDAAALTVENGTLEILDSFKTTGAELAVGNNARMYIGNGGRLVIHDSCQVEVEYDAASVAPTEGGSATPITYDNGLITIANGGVVENYGIISIEGTEGKPIDPAAPAIRDMKAAELHIEAGGTLINNGALVAYGGLYNLGTIQNNGHYTETIESHDPDKGLYTYHKGIQVAWKDDVTQSGVRMGYFSNGEEGKTGAVFTNNGDLVLAPGFLENYGTLENTASGNLYLCEVDEAMIPVQVPWSVLIIEERINLGRPMAIYFTNFPGAALTNAGTITAADVEIAGNGNLGALTAVDPAQLVSDICVDNFGSFQNSGNIRLGGLYTFAPMENTGSIANKIILEASTQTEGSLTDSAGLTEVYNGTKSGDTWSRVACKSLSITPTLQAGKSGETVKWTLKAETDDPTLTDVRYFAVVFHNNETTPELNYTITANSETEVASPVLPWTTGNVVYRLHLLDGLESAHANATVKVTKEGIQAPTAIEELVYNGKAQALVTSGATAEGTLQYRLGETGEWSNEIPTATNAGSYKVYYRLSGDDTEEQLSVDSTIAPKPATVSAADATTQVGVELTELSCSVSGLVSGDQFYVGSLDDDPAPYTITTTANENAAGEYPITVTVNKPNPNYKITTREGKYTVTESAFTVVAKDKYGVFSDETSYTGFNIELTVPQGASAYYSTTTELTRDNYQTYGMTALTNQPAAAGIHTVYYYVTDGTNAVSGSKQVFIDKAAQTAPDAAKLTTRSESWLNSGDGRIQGFTPYKMEYRNVENDGTYTMATMELANVEPGTYLVRMAADDNHYASPDTTVTVAAGEPITVSFDLNGSESAIDDVTGLVCGDLLARPAADPTMPDANFLGWFYMGSPYDFNAPVTQSITLFAAWAPAAIDFKLPAETVNIEDAAFECVPMKSVEIPTGCVSVYDEAFKNCTALRQVLILSPKTQFSASAFNGCENLYIFAPEGSNAADLCTLETGFVFVEIFQ